MTRVGGRRVLLLPAHTYARRRLSKRAGPRSKGVDRWSDRAGRPRTSISTGRAWPGSTTTTSAARTTSPPTGRSPSRCCKVDARTCAADAQATARSCAGPCATCAAQGVQQFLDLGSGIPTVGQRARDRSVRPAAGWSTSTTTRWRSRTAGPSSPTCRAPPWSPPTCASPPTCCHAAGARAARLHPAGRVPARRGAALRARRGATRPTSWPASGRRRARQLLVLSHAGLDRPLTAAEERGLGDRTAASPTPLILRTPRGGREAARAT